jgi:hypothetical protein
LGHKEIAELFKNEAAAFNLKSENARTIDCNIWRRKGLRQDDALSAKLFLIVLKKVVRNIQTNPNGTIINRTRQCMTYADNMFMLGLSVKAIEEVVTQITEAAVSTGLVPR